MDSIAKIIKVHNARLERSSEPEPTCNCQSSRTCPVDGDCNVSCVVYKAEVTINEQELPKVYIGLSEPPLKERIRNHYKAINDDERKYVNDSAFSEYIWQLKDQGINDYGIKWSILKRAPKYNKTRGTCSLCISEKLMISQFEDKNRLLNKRLELATHCLHFSKHLLGNFSPGVD